MAKAATVKDVPIWKYQASLGENVPSRVRVPVSSAELLKLYVPTGKVMPPRSPVNGVAEPRWSNAL